MDWLYSLFVGGGIAHTVFTLALVITAGILLGKVKVCGISLGITWILFVGIIAAHFGMGIPAEVRHFIQEFGMFRAILLKSMVWIGSTLYLSVAG